MTYTSPAIAEIDGRFIDCNFENEAADGGFSLGCNPMTDDDRNRLFGAGGVTDFPASELIPESQWDDYIKRQDVLGGWLERRLKHIRNQGSEGSCVANGSETAKEIAEAMAWGDDQVRRGSAISVYRECAPGPGTGSNVGDVMRQEIDVGSIPSNKCPVAAKDVAAGYYKYTHPDTGYSVRPPADWKTDTAKFFRVDEWWRLPNLQSIFSASFKGGGVVGARSRHCICFVRWFLKNGKRVFCYVNSWSDTWGESLEISTGPTKGFGFDSQSTVASWAGREAWCPRTIVKPSWLK
jgi:hypothetical protein